MRMIMNKKRFLVAGAIAAAALVGVTGGVAASGVTDDNEEPITGDALVEASRVALEHTGEGRVSDTEVGDEDSYYEVEVTLDDGSEVDVQLDEEFNVVGAEAETSGEADDD